MIPNANWPSETLAWERSQAARLLADPKIRLLAVDLRGTLVRAPSITNLVQELETQGVNKQRALSAQRAFDTARKGPLAERSDILDWTSFAAMWMANELDGGSEIDLDAIEAEFRIRYLEQSRALVDAETLATFTRRARVEIVVVADGPQQREQDLILKSFPKVLLDLVTSERLGVNKLTADFYARLRVNRSLCAHEVLVVGDRLDKDIAPAEAAGCRAILVGSSAGTPSVKSFSALIAGHPCWG